MFGKSSSLSSTSFSGSGALSHVYIQSPPLRCRVPGSRSLYYDDGNKLLISTTSDQVIQTNKSRASLNNAQFLCVALNIPYNDMIISYMKVFTWKTVPFTPTVSPTCDLISEGSILSVRFSLDAKVIAIQRSGHEILFQDRETKKCFTHRCKTESESILGFFWTDCPTCDIVIVKTRFVMYYVYFFTCFLYIL